MASPAITAYAEYQTFKFKASHVNTGASTLNVNGKGAVAIKKGVNQDLVAGDIPVNAIIEVVHDGTYFQLRSIKDLSTVFTAAGDLIVGTAANTPSKLAMGTALQSLRVNAGATGLEYASLTMPMDKLGFVTLSSPTSQVDFVSIPAGYKMFMLLFSAIYNGAGEGGLWLRFNDDVTSGNYISMSDQSISNGSRNIVQSTTNAYILLGSYALPPNTYAPSMGKALISNISASSQKSVSFDCYTNDTSMYSYRGGGAWTNPLGNDISKISVYQGTLGVGSSFLLLGVK
jgi:hypothetical protein